MQKCIIKLGKQSSVRCARRLLYVRVKQDLGLPLLEVSAGRREDNVNSIVRVNSELLVQRPFLYTDVVYSTTARVPVSQAKVVG